jgi:two-component system response regulator EvgA
MQRALIIDQHPVIRFALHDLLIDQNFTEIAEVNFDECAISEAFQRQPEFIIVGTDRQESAAFAIIKKLVMLSSTSKIIVFAADPTDDFSRCCLQIGAASVVSKSKDLSELISVVRDVVAEHSFPNPNTQKFDTCRMQNDAVVIDSDIQI